MLILYGPMAGISVGKMFMAAIPSGLTLSVLYIAYIVIRCWIDPISARRLQKKKRKKFPWRKRCACCSRLLCPPSF